MSASNEDWTVVEKRQLESVRAALLFVFFRTGDSSGEMRAATGRELFARSLSLSLSLTLWLLRRLFSPLALAQLWLRLLLALQLVILRETCRTLRSIYRTLALALTSSMPRNSAKNSSSTTSAAT